MQKKSARNAKRSARNAVNVKRKTARMGNALLINATSAVRKAALIVINTVNAKNAARKAVPVVNANLRRNHNFIGPARALFFSLTLFYDSPQ